MDEWDGKQIQSEDDMFMLLNCCKAIKFGKFR